MDSAEVEFLAEKEMVTIIPNFSLDKIYLIGVIGFWGPPGSPHPADSVSSDMPRGPQFLPSPPRPPSLSAPQPPRTFVPCLCAPPPFPIFGSHPQDPVPGLGLLRSAPLPVVPEILLRLISVPVSFALPSPPLQVRADFLRGPASSRGRGAFPLLTPR
ncbi:DNA replication complex GINS protein PSF2 isoform X2 [Antechinus flavipes]|uniref:DNA replication complex GINS protein PSF2 isoform X2 n=1 Tax=Antechinus flavipes TaxID=38775 RepID=UPI0022356430|nr:DNA replication complex GINS protein PSF2 isoform X2 [Antechinus flavipes]